MQCFKHTQITILSAAKSRTVRVYDVHRTALATVKSAYPVKNFKYHIFNIASLDDRAAMATMRGANEILIAKMCERLENQNPTDAGNRAST